jgi:release factor glutamine methyltransferase
VKSIGEVLNLSVQYLKDRKIDNARRAVEALMSHVLKKKRIELYMYFDLPLQEPELEVLRSFVKRAALGEPVEYITLQVDFYGCNLLICPDVLIPRQETEILVDKAASLLQAGEGKVLWDICTGSGCIGLSLKKKFPAFSVTLADICPNALQVCKKNAESNALEVEIVQGDLLEPFAGKKADYIFCNPPYIAQKEYESLDPSVKDYEPAKALIGGESGLVFYERLAKELPLHMNAGGKVFLEIGAGQGLAMQQIFYSPFWKKKEIICDYAGLDRFFFLEIE